MNRRRLFVLAGLSLLALWLMPASLATTQPSAGGAAFVRLAAGQVEAARRLGLQPVRALDYGAFHWLELTQADLATLSASGVPFTAVPDAGKINVPNYRFDPLRDGEPALDRQLTASGSGPGFYLVQLAGPTNDAWLAQLAGAGLRPLQYYPHNSFLVWGDAGNLATTAQFDFVRWQGRFHPAYKINSDLNGRSGQIANVDIMVYDDGHLDSTLQAIAALGGDIIQAYPSQPDKAFYDAIARLDAGTITAIAQLPTVLWLGYASPQPGLEDEMSGQIVAGNHPGGVPVPGYYDHLAELGYDGSGVIWGIIDTGVDYDHPDLGSHIVSGYDFPGACVEPGQPGSDCATGGHGTHVAGIVGGDATGGFTDGSGFLYGLGIAPGYSIYASNSLSGGPWPPSGGWQEHSKRAVLGGAIGGNNSWTTGEGTQHGYQASERTHDIMVLDGNFDTTTVAEPFIEVFSAGNSGFAGLTAPKEGKNLIVTAASLNYRVGSIDSIASFSSRGPAVDGRWVPTITAPGDEIASARNDTGGVCATPIPGTDNLYAFCSGTSMAAPHTSGTITVITEWWRATNLAGGADPSPAMAKALVVNGAVDMGTPDIPNINEGWGRINVTNVISPGVPAVYQDQQFIFHNTGEQFTLTAGVPDPSQPLKVTLAWADAPGAVGANPALVNDLDLTVVNGGNTYLGNVFAGGWSTTGGSVDSINNLENVYVQNPGSSVSIVIDAANISGDAILYDGDLTDQGFALICQNCSLFPDFSLAATPAAQDICAPDDAIYSIDVASILGYSDLVTLSASGYPDGTSASFSVNPVLPPGTSELTISNTGAAAAGNYTIQLTGTAPTSTHDISLGLDLFDGVPGAVALISPPDGATNEALVPTFEWGAASQGVSTLGVASQGVSTLGVASQGVDYSLEVASDPGFNNIIYSATVAGTSHTMTTALEPLTTYYWRVQAGNVCGAGSYSATWSFTTRDIPPILLVDDDDNSPDVQSYYSDALDSLGLTYDIWDTNNSDDEPSAAELLPYDMVVWFTGDEFGGFAGPGAAGETALASYLDDGNCLFISSQDYVWDRGVTSFMQDYLGVSAATSDVGQSSVTGQGTVYGGAGSFSLAYPFTNYSDQIVPDSTAELAFSGNAGDAAVDKDNGVYRTTFWGFPFEALPTAGDRTDLMSTTLNWCGSTPAQNLLRSDLIQMKVRNQGQSVGARVFVVDENGAPVPGAAVQIAWSGVPGGNDVALTDGLGRAKFGVAVTGPGAYTLTVINILKPGYTFDPGGSAMLTRTLVVNPSVVAR